MAENLVNYKYTDTLKSTDGQLKPTDTNDLIFVNKGFDDNATEADGKFGSVYKGDKLVGTTEADKLVLTETIDVVGTTVGGMETGDKFEKGTDILSVLKEICRKELGVTKTLPTITCNNIGTEAGVYEVGTTITPEFVTEYEDGSFDAVEGWGEPQKASCIAGAVKYYRNNVEFPSNADNYTLSDETINYIAKQAYGASETVPVSNIGTKLTSEKIAAGNVTSEKITFTGAYKYFIGAFSDFTFGHKSYTSDSIRMSDMVVSDFINSEDKTSVDRTIVVPAGTKGVYVAIPKGVDDTGSTLRVKHLSAFDLSVSEEMISNKQTVPVICAGSAVKEYVVFTWSFPAGTVSSEVFEISQF